MCIGLDTAPIDVGPAAKRFKAAPSAYAPSGGKDGAFRVRHILLKHQQVRVLDPCARREGSAAGAQEAEEAGLRLLEELEIQFIQLNTNIIPMLFRLY